MRLFLALAVLGGSTLLQGISLYRRGERGEIVAISVISALAMASVVIYEYRPEWLTAPMDAMRWIFDPIGDAITGGLPRQD